MESYSQVGQDLFVLSLIPVGTFLDIGCRGPEDLNNTLLLEQHGWTGVSIDIADYSEQWKRRSTPFVCSDALSCDYEKILRGMPFLIDYLSLDIEGNGYRYRALERIMKVREFKIITIEHDAYCVPEEMERIPQRQLLSSLGYELYRPDVSMDGQAFEDWWINPIHINHNI